MNKVKFRYTLPAQLIRIVKGHASAAFILAILWLMMASFWTGKVGSYIFTVIGTLGYFWAIYNAAFDTALDDKKSYSPLKAIPWKGIYLPILLTVLNIAVIVIYKCSWIFGATDGMITSVGGIIGNVFSVLWFCMYKALLGMDKGHFEIQGYLIIILLPYLASFLGYFAGYKDYDIYGKINSLAYEKSKKKKR